MDRKINELNKIRKWFFEILPFNTVTSCNDPLVWHHSTTTEMSFGWLHWTLVWCFTIFSVYSTNNTGWISLGRVHWIGKEKWMFWLVVVFKLISSSNDLLRASSRKVYDEEVTLHQEESSSKLINEHFSSRSLHHRVSAEELSSKSFHRRVSSEDSFTEESPPNTFFSKVPSEQNKIFKKKYLLIKLDNENAVIDCKTQQRTKIVNFILRAKLKFYRRSVDNWIEWISIQSLHYLYDKKNRSISLDIEGKSLSIPLECQLFLFTCDLLSTDKKYGIYHTIGEIANIFL